MWIRRGTEEKRYDIEPSTTPTEPSWYEVAKLALAREESVRRRPRGVWKFNSAVRIGARLTLVYVLGCSEDGMRAARPGCGSRSWLDGEKIVYYTS